MIEYTGAMKRRALEAFIINVMRRRASAGCAPRLLQDMAVDNNGAGMLRIWSRTTVRRGLMLKGGGEDDGIGQRCVIIIIAKVELIISWNLGQAGPAGHITSGVVALRIGDA